MIDEQPEPLASVQVPTQGEGRLTYGRFQRMIPLPRDIDAENAEASFKKGVLSVRFPKTPEKSSQERRIPIEAE